NSSKLSGLFTANSSIYFFILLLIVFIYLASFCSYSSAFSFSGKLKKIVIIEFIVFVISFVYFNTKYDVENLCMMDSKLYLVVLRLKEFFILGSSSFSKSSNLVNA